MLIVDTMQELAIAIPEAAVRTGNDCGGSLVTPLQKVSRTALQVLSRAATAAAAV